MLRRDLLKRVTAVVCGVVGIKAVAETPAVDTGKIDLLWGPDYENHQRFIFHNDLPPNSFAFYQNYGQKEVARIGSDGIMRFSIDATDENAKRFVDLIEQLINRQLTGISVDVT